jgi:hypothetical protein
LWCFAFFIVFGFVLLNKLKGLSLFYCSALVLCFVIWQIERLFIVFIVQLWFCVFVIWKKYILSPCSTLVFCLIVQQMEKHQLGFVALRTQVNCK